MLIQSVESKIYSQDICSALSFTPTINGSARTPSVLYRGDMVSTAAWVNVYGEDLAIAGSGTDPEISGHAIKFNAGKYMASSSTTLVNLGTDDFVLEAVVKAPVLDSAIAYVEAGANTSSPFLFLYWGGVAGGSTFAADFRDVDASINVRPPNSATLDRWHHLMVFVNRDEASTNGCGMFGNGTMGSGVNPANIAGTLNPATTLKIGGADFASWARCNTWVAWFALWKASGMIQAGAAGKNEIATLAAARSAQVYRPGY